MHRQADPAVPDQRAPHLHPRRSDSLPAAASGSVAANRAEDEGGRRVSISERYIDALMAAEGEGGCK